MTSATSPASDATELEPAAAATNMRVVSLAGPAIVAAIFAAWNIGAESFWLDESTSLVFARMPWSDFWPLASGPEINMTLYYVLLRGWVTAGTSEAWVRALGAIFAVASVPVFQLLASRLFGWRAGLVAALLLATSPFLIFFAQEARGYGLAMLMTCGASLLLLRALDRPSTARWAGYALVGGLSLYAHLFAAFVLAAHALVVALAGIGSPHVRSRWPGMIGALVGIALLGVPILLAVTAPGRDYIGHVPPPELLFVLRAGYLVAGGSVPLTVASAVLVALGAVVSVRAWRSAPAAARIGLLLAWAWFLVPPLASLAISVAKPIFYPRYLLVMLPGLVLVMALALDAVRPRRWGTVALAAVIGLAGLQLAIQATEDENEDWRGAATSVLAQARPGDGVIFVSASGGKPFGYYVERMAAADRAPVPIWPRVRWGDPHPVPGPLPDVDRSLEAVPDHERIWLVVSHEERSQEILDDVLTALRSTHVVDETLELRGVEIGLWERATPAAPG